MSPGVRSFRPAAFFSAAGRLRPRSGGSGADGERAGGRGTTAGGGGRRGGAPPDAVFAANNRTAMGALRAFRAAGRRLPLIGFDDFEAATLAEPAVSVVAQDVAGMGARAAEAAIARLAGGGGDAATVVLPTRLVLRGSER
jgi:DNA-binding LacI/PurR family transcriptional regulator